jgi:hypothetical protein
MIVTRRFMHITLNLRNEYLRFKFAYFQLLYVAVKYAVRFLIKYSKYKDCVAFLKLSEIVPIDLWLQPLC